jgi:hypothetical protein
VIPDSPVTSVGKTLLTLVVCLGLGLILGAPGVVHSGKGMPDGPARSITLALGGGAQAIADITHLNLAWTLTRSALGRPNDQTSSPLLATGPSQPIHAPPAKPGATPPKGTPASGQPLPAAAGRPTKTVRRGLPIPTVRKPLRLLITGDSLTEFMGPTLVNMTVNLHTVTASTDTHYGTGLVRPDFVDWSIVARQQMASQRPQAVVVFMGGNDFQNITMPDGHIVMSGTTAWTREYARRAAICMRIWAPDAQHRVYWLSLPPARDTSWAQHNAEIDQALRQAATQVPNARYLDINGPITDHGHYADFITVGGRTILVRTPDGIHLTEDGSAIVAREVLATIKRDWRIR